MSFSPLDVGSKKDPVASYLRSSHHQPDLVKVSSPKLSELTRLEHILDEKNRENEQLRSRLKHNAKGFEALALTVDHLTKKVSITNFWWFSVTFGLFRSIFTILGHFGSIKGWTFICLISTARCHYLSRLTCFQWNKAKIATFSCSK